MLSIFGMLAWPWGRGWGGVLVCKRSDFLIDVKGSPELVLKEESRVSLCPSLLPRPAPGASGGPHKASLPGLGT